MILLPSFYLDFIFMPLKLSLISDTSTSGFTRWQTLCFYPLKSLISEVVILAPYYHAYIEFSKQNSKNRIPTNAK